MIDVLLEIYFDCFYMRKNDRGGGLLPYFKMYDFYGMQCKVGTVFFIWLDGLSTPKPELSSNKSEYSYLYT